MFPVLTVEVSGLEPEARYFVLMEICLSSDRRYKFVGREWKATGKADLQLPRNSRVFIHQDSPATGSHWMREAIKMKAAKLTNNSANRSGHVSFWPHVQKPLEREHNVVPQKNPTIVPHQNANINSIERCPSLKADSCSAN
jgi:hypothetical protein